ncbi:MAG: squalene/phytoene synthase family protein [Rhodovibrio sp.]|nr:squalene/phytoene synthase family protein [Rhodovibrio sp.]
MSAIETPSGKGRGDENFPVASRLIAPRLRGHVMAYYAFARAADDIADNPELAPADKIDRLDRLGAALRGEASRDDVPVADRLRASLLETGVPLECGLDLLTAFKQDAVKGRYADWEELLGYCVNSANPVGRFLLDLHGEPAPPAAVGRAVHRATDPEPPAGPGRRLPPARPVSTCRRAGWQRKASASRRWRRSARTRGCAG